MTQSSPPGPVLFCYDGSEGSREAMRTAGELIEASAEVVVVTVWEPIGIRLALSGAFAYSSIPNETELDEREAASAKATSEDGAQRAVEHGYKASAVAMPASEGVARAILAVADQISARLIVVGQRGRGPVKSALLGSVSHALAGHTRRPVLISPEKSA